MVLCVAACGGTQANDGDLSLKPADLGVNDQSTGDQGTNDFATAVGDLGTDAALATESSLLLEPLGNPRLRFADGQVANNAPALFPGSPAIAGFQPSSWYVAQWKKTELMKPDVLFENAASATDPMLGVSRWAFPSTDNQSHVWIWEPVAGPRIFELYGEHGWLDAAGGSNVFLSINAIAEVYTSMELPTHLVMSAKIAHSSVTFTAPNADTDGSVLWQAFTGLIFQYVPPNAAPRTVLFLQIAHADSRNQTGTYLSYGGNAALYGGRLAGDPSIYGDKPNGALTPLDFDLNAYLCDAVGRSYPMSGGGTFTFPVEAHDLHNWRFSSMYSGIETQDRLDTSTAATRGSDLVAFQVSGIDVRKATSGTPLAACP